MNDTIRQQVITTTWPPATSLFPTMTTIIDNITTTDLPSTTVKPDECEPNDLVWIKIALLLAILVCLIILICSLCITSFCYFSSLNAPNTLVDTNDARGSSSAVNQPAYPTLMPARLSLPLGTNELGPNNNGVVPNNNIPATANTNTLTGFKRLSVTQDTPRAPLSSSLQSPNTSSFSINMAPPSPRSLALGMGMDSPEETVVKKLALDRIEQEEAKRHNDLALMAEKSTSMSPLKEQLKLEPDEERSLAQARKPERKQSEPLPQAKKKKKRRSVTKASKGSKGSDPSAQTPPAAHKNPSFTLDNKTNKLLIGSSIKNADATASPDKKYSV